jgi:SAM-dependent methyltransferase
VTGSGSGYAVRARYYDVEYQARSDQPFLRSLVTGAVRSILEIPCGAGRNLPWLAATGRQVVCADLEPQMVRRVRERARQLGAGARVRGVVADLRTVDLDQCFDLVLVPQEAFQLLTGAGEAVAALGRLRAHLAPGGTLLVDLHSFTADRSGEPDAVLDYFDPALPDGVATQEWTRAVTGGQLSRRRTQWSDGQTVRILYVYALSRPAAATGHWESEVVLRRYRLAEFARLAGRAELRVTSASRNYAGDPYLPGSARAVVLLRAGSAGSGHVGR